MKKVLVLLLGVLLFAGNSFAANVAQKNFITQQQSRCLGGSYDACISLGSVYYAFLHPQEFETRAYIRNFLAKRKKQREKFLISIWKNIVLAKNVCVGNTSMENQQERKALCRMLAGYMQSIVIQGTKDVQKTTKTKKRKKLLKKLEWNEEILLEYLKTVSERFHDIPMKKHFLILCRVAKINPNTIPSGLKRRLPPDEEKVVMIIQRNFQKRGIKTFHLSPCKITYTMSNDGKHYNAIEDCRSFQVSCSSDASFNNNACAVNANYASAVDTQVAKVMRKHGYSFSGRYNITSAFTAYVAKSFNDFYKGHFFPKNFKTFIEKMSFTAQILTDMLDSGDIVHFQELVDIFVKNEVLKKYQ